MWAPPSYLAGCSQAVWQGGNAILARNYDYAPERLEGDEESGYGADVSKDGAVVGLGFIGSPASLPVLKRVASDDIIWLVRDEARQVSVNIQLTKLEAGR